MDLLRIATDGAHVGGTAAVGADGAFTIEGLWPGTYRASFRLAPSGEEASATVD